MKIGVAKERAPNEARVALVPEALKQLAAAGAEIIVEQGAGQSAAFPDQAYADAGARLMEREQLYADADVVLRVGKPGPDDVRLLRDGQVVVGLLQPLLDPQLMKQLADKKVTAISLDALPRTLSRAQPMDALSSQANVGGYRAVLVAAEAYGRYFPLLTTAAGTARPANVLVLGIGVAGLQAIATARRLGAVVKAYDVRSETREQAESLGASFIVLESVADASGGGGYARELSAEEREAQQRELNDHIAGMDVVITTAQVPGRRPPLLVTAAAVGGMKPGSVIVDMAASALGGNVEVSRPDEKVVTDSGVVVLAPTNLPATMPAGASQFYARNIGTFVAHFIKDGALSFDFDDEITAATVITHNGAVVQHQTKALLEPAAEPAGEPATKAAEANR
jgi:H+-translocating NAD(P) transhydrogenase subunit alpha